jgi:hypothetical protein
MSSDAYLHLWEDQLKLPVSCGQRVFRWHAVQHPTGTLYYDKGQ